MGISLISYSGRDMSMTLRGWCKALHLAELHGWKPEGTRKSNYEEFARGLESGLIVSGDPDKDGYCTNDYNEVSERDALNLGRALVFAAAEKMENREYASAAFLLSIASVALAGSFLIG